MKTTTTLSAAALLLAAAQQCAATHGHRLAHNHFDKRHHLHGHSHGDLESRNADSNTSPVERGVVDARETPEAADVEILNGLRIKRSVQCSLPSHADLVSVTSGNDNKGFAMSPDQPCNAGMYCPIACRSGMVMAQWQPGSSYGTTSRMNGGLLCGDDGVPTKPYPNSPYCVEGTGTVTAVNTCGKVVSFCQTVLPGNEAMLIPTDVTGTSTLAIPGPDYWAGTSAHYYINPPGVGSGEGCVWGTEANNIGNWAPYVAGGNTDSAGQTFVTLSWNPIYEASKWASTVPSYGVRIECDGTCNGTPCEIDPSKTGLKAVKSNNGASGAGGANFCVVTVAKGSTARIVIFNTDGSTGSGSSSSSSTSAPAPAPTTTTTSAGGAGSTSTSTREHQTSSYSAPTVLPGGRFHENSTSTDDDGSSTGVTGSTTSAPTGTAGSGAATTTTSTKSEGVGSVREKGGAAVVGLIVALVAAAWLY